MKNFLEDVSLKLLETFQEKIQTQAIFQVVLLSASHLDKNGSCQNMVSEAKLCFNKVLEFASSLCFVDKDLLIEIALWFQEKHILVVHQFSQ